MARLSVQDAEATEAKRCATEQDWLRGQASRGQEFRESRRANPVTSIVAHWAGTTESRLNLLLDFVGMVVLEGAPAAPGTSRYRGQFGPVVQ